MAVVIGILVHSASLFGVFFRFIIHMMQVMTTKTTIVTITPITTAKKPEDDKKPN